MRVLFYLIIFFIIINCSTKNGAYWCGDHPCIDKKEKKAYFKKTMIVEIKKLKKDDLKNNSEVEKIIQQTKSGEKIRIKEEKKTTKQAKLEKKLRIKEEKKIAKQAKLEKKLRIKEEKKLSKRIESDEKRMIKKENKTSKNNVNFDNDSKNVPVVTSNFNKMVEKIIEKNTFRPYPDINDIPN